MPASMLSPAPIVLRAATGIAAKRSHPLRCCQQGAFLAERQDDDVAAALFDDLLRRAFLLALGADFSPDQILQLAQARF